MSRLRVAEDRGDDPLEANEGILAAQAVDVDQPSQLDDRFTTIPSRGSILGF